MMFNARTYLLGAALSLATAFAAAAHPAQFTIEQVMEAPYPSDLTVAPSGRAVAWVFDTKGVRNVWIADPASPTGRAHAITSFAQDGVDIGEIAWSPDRKWIAFTRAETLEDPSPANVNNSPDGPSGRDVWIVPVAGGTARKIAGGHAPSFAPDGGRVIFADRTTILAAPVDGKAPPQPLVVDKWSLSSVTWSPDGRRFAFSSHRGSHTLIGVYDTVAKTIAWMSPSLDHDASAAFSPDGSQLAFIRVPSEKSLEFVSRRVGQPWSIWVADTVTGAGRRIFLADAGVGSAFRPTLSTQNLLWTADNRLVFPWEKTGWVQLYSVGARGGDVRPLTSGAFEVAHMGFGSDRRHLLVSSNQDDIDGIHVWSFDVQSGAAARLAADAAIEDYPELAADGTAFALRSEATVPLRPVVLSDGRWQPLAPDAVGASFPSAQLVTPQAVVFTAKDGQQAHAQLFVPKDGAASHPAILFFHGGPQRQIYLGFHPMGAYNWTYAMNQYLASEGYIVLSVNYRGGIGYGLNYREPKDFGPDGGSELNDLLGAVTYLKSRTDVDARRIGIYGASYGGLMTALGLARDSKEIAAGVDYAGLYDWAAFLSAIGAPVDAGAATQKAVASSPVATIDQWHSPVLIVQADDDRNVPSEEASHLIEDLRSHNIAHDEIMIPNEIHDLARYGSWIALFRATDAYFQEHLSN
ncbi:MAG: prolyl oligopeptidase family serine peptidase [Rhizomicrobium sp.]